MAAALVSREFERSVIDEGNQIRERIKRLLKQASHLRLNKGVPNRPLRRLTAPFVGKESDVVGRDGDKEQIIELLLSADTSRCFIELLLSADTSRCFIELLRRSLSCCHGDKEEIIGNNLSVIPIVGMGGIGKTTLAQLVYKESRVQQHFDLKVWVTVSEEFDVFQITKGIYEKVVNSEECKIRELFELQSKLNEALVGKKFLLVLDDVWNENYGRWESLKSGFQSGAHGSRIIVTTRSKVVASTMCIVAMHELNLVSVDDCWQISVKHAFVDNQAPTELQKIGLEIVARCKGLPLAVKSVAGVLRSTSNPEEWRQMLLSDIWQLQFQENLKNDIVPTLWLSYRFLPPALKRCFAYFSIFPKDYEFHQWDMEKIILLWKAEGLLTPEKGKRMEDVGKAYLQALISRSFFQQSSTRWGSSAMVMHDLVHDLAMFISGEFCFSCGDSNDLSNLGTKSYHLSYRRNSDVLMKLGAVSKSREKKLMSLHTLLALPLSYESVYNKPVLELHELFLKVGGCLRVLSLSCYQQITKFPDSIGNMKYLRYLDLSQTIIKELPDSICTFYNLQTLLLSDCPYLLRLPTRLAALVNLHHLDIRGTQALKEMPPHMCKMKSLETLSDFVLGENDGQRIKELGELPLLGGRLRISGLEYIVDVKDVLEANLKDKKFLSELILEWGWRGRRSSQQEREDLAALQPHTNLKQLRISGYRGTIFPDWVGHESFCNMVQVDLWWCRNVYRLPTLGQLSSLRSLVIQGLDSVVSIGNEFCGSPSTTTNHRFTSLEDFRIYFMGSWEEWSFSSDRLGQEGGFFPSLTKLYMEGCKKLIVGLPDCQLPSLKGIEIKRCDEMVGLFVCQSDTNTFPSLQSIKIRECKKLKGLIDNCDEMEGVFVCQSRQEIDTNAFPFLQSIEINRCKKLWENRMKWGLERLPSLMTLSLEGIRIAEEVDSFPEEGLLPTTLTHLSISWFIKLKGLNGRGFQHLTSLQNLEIRYCKELECLPQVGLPLSLSCLTIYECPVLEQRCQRGTGEDWPKIQHIPKIDIGDYY